MRCSSRRSAGCARTSRALLRELLTALEFRIDVRALGRLGDTAALRGVVQRLREEGLVSAAIGPERRAALDRVQATMAVIEGHAEHVMDAAGADALPNLDALRGALDRRRRDRPPLWRVFERLIGLDMKMRQYETGKRFCDAVVDRGGVEALNRAFAASRGAARPGREHRTRTAGSSAPA